VTFLGLVLEFNNRHSRSSGKFRTFKFYPSLASNAASLLANRGRQICYTLWQFTYWQLTDDHKHINDGVLCLGSGLGLDGQSLSTGTINWCLKHSYYMPVRVYRNSTVLCQGWVTVTIHFKVVCMENLHNKSSTDWPYHYQQWSATFSHVCLLSVYIIYIVFSSFLYSTATWRNKRW